MCPQTKEEAEWLGLRKLQTSTDAVIQMADPNGESAQSPRVDGTAPSLPLHLVNPGHLHVSRSDDLTNIAWGIIGARAIPLSTGSMVSTIPKGLRWVSRV